MKNTKDLDNPFIRDGHDSATVKENNIPIIKPEWGTAIDFDTNNCITKIYLDWEDFYKMSRPKQIDELEFILQSLREIPDRR